MTMHMRNLVLCVAHADESRSRGEAEATSGGHEYLLVRGYGTAATCQHDVYSNAPAQCRMPAYVYTETVTYPEGAPND